MRKSGAERMVESLTWALVVIWLGVMLIAGGLQYAWLVMMVLGIILLTSAIYQHLQGWETSFAIWIFGVWMAVFSVVELADELIAAANDGKGLGIDLGVYLGIALISMGIATMLRMIRGVGNGAGAGNGTLGQGATGNYTSVAPTIRPRVVHDNTGTGMYGPSRYRPDALAGPGAPTWDSRSGAMQTSASRYGHIEEPTAYADSLGRTSAYGDRNAPSRYGEEHAPLYGDTEYDAFGDAYDDLLDDPDELPQLRYSHRRTRSQRRPRPAMPSEDTEALSSRAEEIVRHVRQRRDKLGPEELADDFIRRAKWDEGDIEDLPY